MVEVVEGGDGVEAARGGVGAERGGLFGVGGGVVER